MGVEKALEGVKVIKDQIQYRSQSLLNSARGTFNSQIASCELICELQITLHSEVI